MSNFGRQSVLGVVFLLVLAPCNVAREAIVGAAAPLVPTLAVVQDAPLAPAVGNVLDMDADNTFAYAVTDTSVVKAALSDLANQGSHVLTTTAGMQWTGFTTLQVDDRALYITAKRNVPAFRNSEPYQLLQFDKNTMMFLMSRKLSLGDGVPYSIAQDSASLYLGTYSFPGKILRVGKFGAMHIMESLDLPQGANDVRSMELDRATETLYANCNTMPGRVVKIKLHTGNHDASPMSVTGTAIFQAGVGHVATGTTRSIALASKHAPSGSRVYVATNQQPANVVAIDAELMETMGSSVKLSPGEDLASALVEDRDYLYIGLWEKATIVRLTKTPFARESAFDLLQGAEAGRVTSMLLARVQSSNFLIVGMQGSPSRLAKITGPVQPVHQASAKACEASGWGEWSPCSATCGPNLVVLPKEQAFDFLLFCQRNPKPCPLLDVTDAGNPEPALVAPGADVRTDCPKYHVYRHGVLEETVTDITSLWQPDSVAFLLGCSFSFEEALLRAGLPVRNIEEGKIVPMFRTSTQCRAAGAFAGPQVVSMRPYTPAQAADAVRVTARFPRVHGAPVHIGEPAALAIADISKPDWGEPVTVREGEIPLFWACGVTPQAAAMASKPALMITHAPGHMFVTSKRNEELALG
eukprot:g341.t1